jgi:hypothetical protein
MLPQKGTLIWNLIQNRDDIIDPKKRKVYSMNNIETIDYCVDKKKSDLYFTSCNRFQPYP